MPRAVLEGLFVAGLFITASMLLAPERSDRLETYVMGVVLGLAYGALSALRRRRRSRVDEERPSEV